MERWQRFKRTFPKVEIITFGIIIEVGKEAHEHGKTEHEHQMEVGITVLAAIQPLEATHNIVEKRTVILLSPRGIIDKLSQEHADAHLIHVGLHGNVRRKSMNVTYGKQSLIDPAGNLKI